MNILGYKLLFTVLVTFCYNLDRICAQNASQMLIPIIATNLIGPRKFERIIVPVYPTLPHPADEDLEKPVSEKVIDVESTTEEIKPYHRRPKSTVGAKPINLKSYSYVTRTDGFHKKPVTKNIHGPVKFRDEEESSPNEPKQSPEHEESTGPNEIQPLHISPKVFKKTAPDHSKQTVAEKKKKFRDQEERLKLKNLPENPKKVPETDWFDNHGKYNYGIVHHSQKVEEKASVEDTAENESQEIPKEAIAVIHHPPIIATTTSHPAILKSSFKNPNSFSQVHQNNNDGQFLYKSEVFYPTYRDHIYLPVTTYYGDPTVFPKQFPVYNAHTVYHTPHVHVHNANDNNVQNVPIKVPLPIPNDQPSTVKSSPSPKKAHAPAVHKKEPTIQKHSLPSKKPAEKPSSPPQKHQEDEYQDPEENENDGGKSEYYDYEEGDSVEDDESGNNDKIRGESTEDYEEEEEEEKPRYSYDSKNSFSARDDEKSSEDEFDKAWRKYGYGPKDSSSQENESSESRLVPEIAPGRKKIVHMKMEYYKAPHDGIDVHESASNVENVKAKKPSREINSKMSGTINNSEDKNKKKKKNKKPSVKSQQQHPNAGPDDLKFFQYFNYLGNGEHRAGGRVGNDKHYIEQHERGSEVAGAFQKKVKWADKDGGFGEHYWDLNHGK